MEPVQEIYNITKELKQLLDQLPSDEDREEYLSNIDNLIERRGELIKSLPQTLNNEQVEIVRKTVDLYAEVDESMKKFFHDIESDIVKISQKKKLHNRYAPKPVLVDGMFVDKRK